MFKFLKKKAEKQETKVNQLRLNFPEGLEKKNFKLFNYYLPNGVRKFRHLKFKDFPEVEYISKIENFHLIKLKRQERFTVAYCLISE